MLEPQLTIAARSATNHCLNESDSHDSISIKLNNLVLEKEMPLDSLPRVSVWLQYHTLTYSAYEYRTRQLLGWWLAMNDLLAYIFWFIDASGVKENAWYFDYLIITCQVRLTRTEDDLLSVAPQGSHLKFRSEYTNFHTKLLKWKRCVLNRGYHVLTSMLT